MLTPVCVLTESLDCPEHHGSPAIASKRFAAVMCDAEAPCSVMTSQFADSSRTLSRLSARHILCTLEICAPPPNI